MHGAHAHGHHQELQTCLQRTLRAASALARRLQLCPMPELAPCRWVAVALPQTSLALLTCSAVLRVFPLRPPASSL